MSGKALDDMTPYGQRCYQQGVDDTHERYARMQAQAREWLQACIELVGEWENDYTLDHMTDGESRSREAARQLRAALNLDPSVKITTEPGDES